MKVFSSLVLVLSVVGLAVGFSDIIRAGTNAARGALNTGASLANRKLDLASSIGGENPALRSALGAARNAINSASNAGSSALSNVDSFSNISAMATSLMNTLMNNPWIMSIVNFCRQILTTLGIRL